MDPRNHLIDKPTLATGRIVGQYFRVGREGQIVTQPPCVIDVTRQGSQVSGHAAGFAFSGLGDYDEVTGLMYQVTTRPADGVLVFGVVGHQETAEAALERLLPAELLDVRGLWRGMRERKNAASSEMEADRRFQELGPDLVAELLTNDEPGYRGP